jgi:hypothetical protein
MSICQSVCLSVTILKTDETTDYFTLLRSAWLNFWFCGSLRCSTHHFHSTTNCFFEYFFQNNLTAIKITIQFAGLMQTYAEAYAKCRQEIRDFLIPFVNWMTLSNNGYVPASAATLSSSSSQATLSQQQKNLIANKQLVAVPTRCPALSFTTANFNYMSKLC